MYTAEHTHGDQIVSCSASIAIYTCFCLSLHYIYNIYSQTFHIWAVWDPRVAVSQKNP